MGGDHSGGLPGGFASAHDHPVRSSHNDDHLHWSVLQSQSAAMTFA